MQKFQIEIDGKMESVWRHLPRHRPAKYDVEQHYSEPGMRDGRFVPRRLGPSGVVLVITEQEAGWELWTEAEKLELWPEQPLAFEQIAAIDTTAKCLTTKAGASVRVDMTRKQLSEAEFQIVQQERRIEAMIELSNAVAAGPSPVNTNADKQEREAPRSPEVNETILWHVQQKILDELDTKLKSAPAASLVFTLYCRDRMTLAVMSRKYGWPYRTLKARKAAIEAFMRKNFRLTLKDFFVDRSIFCAAERQLQDHRARSISRRAVADCGIEEDEH